MPARNRSNAAEPQEATVSAIRPHDGQRHLIPSPKVLSGTVVGDPEMRFTGSGKLVTTTRVKDDKADIVWTTKAWEARGELAGEKLRSGDHIKAIGTWVPDREYTSRAGTPEEAKGWSSFEMSVNQIGVFDNDKVIPLDQFDRDALAAAKSLDLTPGADIQPEGDLGVA